VTTRETTLVDIILKVFVDICSILKDKMESNPFLTAGFATTTTSGLASLLVGINFDFRGRESPKPHTIISTVYSHHVDKMTSKAGAALAPEWDFFLKTLKPILISDFMQASSQIFHFSHSPFPFEIRFSSWLYFPFKS
jgi:hypothetical protein